MLAAKENQKLISPFPGLRSFSLEESELFFGREGQSDELARKLGRTRFAAVVGTSGSGKSSLVRAGLLPSLEGGCLVSAGSNWRVVDMRPGSRPIENLANAIEALRLSESPIDPEILRSSSLALIDLAKHAYGAKYLRHDENLLILVDQFEELFRYKAKDMADRDEKAAFVKLLLQVATQRDFPVYVVITMRSDFLGDCARFRDLPETINEGQYLVPRMTREQRREAIEGPIHMTGGKISPRLVQRILNEVGEDPDQLPVMQHALMRTWDHWRSQGSHGPIDIDDYEAVGTLENALSGHADEAYVEASAKLPDRGGLIVRRIFQCLRERDASGRETRRPTSLWELSTVTEASTEEVLTVLECFRREGRSFLMPPMSVDLKADREVDITHESLLRQWKRLLGRMSDDDQGWLAEEEDSRRNILRMADRVGQQTQGSVDYLRGPLLQLAMVWWNKRKPNKAWASRYTPDFDEIEGFLRQSEVVDAAESARERDLQIANAVAAEQKERADAEARSARRLRSMFIALVLAVLIAGTTGISLILKSRELQNHLSEDLDEQRNKRKQLGDANDKLTATNNRLTDATKRLTTSEQNAKDSASEAIRQKKGAVAARIATEAINHISDQQDLAFLLAVEAGREGETAESRKSLLTVIQNDPYRSTLIADRKPTIMSLVAGDDGLISVDSGGQIQISDFQGKHSKSANIDLKATPAVFKLSPDGKTLATITSSTLTLWNTGSGARIKDLPAVPYSLVAFSGDGSRMAWVTSDTCIGLWDVAGAHMLVPTLDVGSSRLTAIALSHDAKLLALGKPDSTITVWDVSKQELESTLRDSRVQRPFTTLEFSVGGFLASGSPDYGTVWNLKDRAARAQLLQLGSVSTFAFSPRGEFLASGSTSGEINLWKVEPLRQLVTLPGHTNTVTHLAFSPDGKALASTRSYESGIGVWTVPPQPRLGEVLPDDQPSNRTTSRLSFSRDGSQLVAVIADTPKDAGGADIRVWNMSHPQNPGTRTLRDLDPKAWALSPNGELVATVVCTAPSSGNCAQNQVRLSRTDGTPALGGPLDVGEGTVTSLAFSPDGREIAVARTISKELRDNSAWQVSLWNLKQRRLIGKAYPTTAEVRSLAFSSDGNILAAGDAKGAVTLWDFPAGRQTDLDARLGQPVSALSFSLDGRKLAATTTRLPNPTAPIIGAPAKSTRRIVTRPIIVLWDVRAGKLSGQLLGTGYPVNLAFSPDNKTLAAGMYDGTTILWDVATSQQLGPALGLRTSSPASVAIHPNGVLLATFSGGITTLWRTDSKSWSDVACDLANRNLTLEEWQKYRQGPYEKTCTNLPLNPDLRKAALVLAARGSEAEALRILRRVKELDPASPLDPEKEVTKAVSEARATDAVSRAIRVIHSNAVEALHDYQLADRLNPSAVSADDWNNVCWQGSLQGFAKTVITACVKAVQMEPDNLGYRDSRGLARSLTGHTQGAIEDFQAFLTSDRYEEYKEQRREWIKALQAGQNPFTPETLKSLKEQ